MVANSLFITGTDVDSGSRNWQKGTVEEISATETRKIVVHEKDRLQRPWRISPKRFVMSVRVYTGDEKTY